MSLKTDYELITHQPLIELATAAMMKAARDIINEAPEEPNHENRLVWAKSITDVNAAKAEVLRVMVWVAANPQLQTQFANDGDLSNVTDDTIQYIINTEAPPRRITPAS